jgi:hypothetical protein
MPKGGLAVQVIPELDYNMLVFNEVVRWSHKWTFNHNHCTNLKVIVPVEPPFQRYVQRKLRLTRVAGPADKVTEFSNAARLPNHH